MAEISRGGTFDGPQYLFPRRPAQQGPAMSPEEETLRRLGISTEPPAASIDPARIRRLPSAIASTPGQMRPMQARSGVIIGDQNVLGLPPPPQEIAASPELRALWDAMAAAETPELRQQAALNLNARYAAPAQNAMAVFTPGGDAKQTLIDPTAGVMAYAPRPRGTEVERQLQAFWDLAHAGETPEVRQEAVRNFNALYAATEGAKEPAGMGATYGQALDTLKQIEANIEDYGAYAPDVEAEVARQRGNLRAGALAETLNLPVATAQALLSAPGGAVEQLLARKLSQPAAQAMASAGMGADPADLRGKTLLEAIAQGGEARVDPLMAAARAMNARQNAQAAPDSGVEGNYAGGFDSGELLNADRFNPMERPIAPGEASIEEIAALLPDSLAAKRQPYAVRQLSGAETRGIYEDSGASKTAGGRRNPFAKERAVSEAAQLFFSPGGVIAQDLQPDLSAVQVPLLVAPKSQERRDRPNTYQIRNVFLAEPGAQKAVPRQSSEEMRILNINPLGELSEDIAKALDLYASAPLDKTDTGSYDARAANVPTPDAREVGGGGGFEPKRDPAAPVAPQRPMTVAEALKAIASRNSAPIRTVRLSDLVGGGIQMDERGNVLGGLKADQLMARDPATGLAAPVDVYPLRPDADLLRASKVNADGERVVDVRIGSKGRYKDSIYGELDQLVGALARQQFGDGGQGGWGMAMNTARPDPVMDSYQRKLLGEAGFDVVEGRNPLLNLVDQLGALQSVPVGEVAIAPASRIDPKSIPVDSPLLANALRQAKIAGRTATGGAAAGELAARQVLAEAAGMKPPAAVAHDETGYRINEPVAGGVASGNSLNAPQAAPIPAAQAADGLLKRTLGGLRGLMGR